MNGSPYACLIGVAVLAACFSSAATAGLGHLLPVINKLQDVMAVSQVSANAIELPQIVVVGSQSSGKSSVLESIVGKDFLPRGSGIVTRAPLILQLQTLTGSSPDGCEEWGEFLHCPKKRFTEFKEIRKEIEDETGRITGKKQAISHTPIRLRITSPKVPNLTLVDLPGMTKVPVGDQPQDIEAQIRDLVLKYTANPNSIILAVTPANSDIATSDAIQISRAVDPAGDRTLGVLTKIDLMDRGTNAREMLTGRVVPLKLGFIGVINRSQKDIIDDKEIDAARKDEMRFFIDHPAYTALAASGHIGTSYLSKRLNQILLNHIKARLPVLRSRISTLMATSRKELQSLGEAPSTDIDEQRKLLISIITQYVENFCTTIDGGRHLTSFTELRGGARVSHTFNQLFPKHLTAIQPLESLRPAEIHTTIRNTKGARTSLYGSVPQDAFEMLVRRLIRQLREPSAWCVDAVYEELRVISEQCEPGQLGRFEKLRLRFREVVAEMLQGCYKEAKRMMDSLIAFELAYINTNHPDFIDVGAVLGTTALSITGPGGPTHGRDPHAADAAAHDHDDAGGGAAAGSTAGAAAPGGGAASAAPPNAPPAAPSLADGGGIAGVATWFGAPSKETATRTPAKPAAPPPAPAPAAPKAPPAGASRQAVVAARRGPASADREARREWLKQGLAAAGLHLDPRDEGEIELVMALITSYFDIVRKNLRDSVPKAIMHLMVNQAKEKVQVELLRNLYREDLLERVLSERPEIRQQRDAARAMLDALGKALSVLNEVNAVEE